MAPTTFPRFGELPKELQLQIWTEAAAIPGKFNLRSGKGGLERWDSSSRGSHCYISGAIFHVTNLLDMWSCRTNLNFLWQVCTARKSLMATCHLARLAALQSWKRNLVAAPMEGDLLHFFELSEGERAQVLEHVQWLIDGSKGVWKWKWER